MTKSLWLCKTINLQQICTSILVWVFDKHKQKNVHFKTNHFQLLCSWLEAFFQLKLAFLNHFPSVLFFSIVLLVSTKFKNISVRMDAFKRLFLSSSIQTHLKLNSTIWIGFVIQLHSSFQQPNKRIKGTLIWCFYGTRTL